MGFHLERDEEVGSGVRRILTEQTMRLSEDLASMTTDSEKAIHEVRKRCKRVRAVLRLAQAKDLQRRENAVFRDIARRFSPFRDAEVRLEAFDELVGNEDGSKRFARLRDLLVEGQASKSLEGQIAHTAKEADAARERLQGVNISNDASFKLVGPGLRCIYKRDRKATSKAYSDSKEGSFHEWQKRVEDLGYQMQILRDRWPAILKRVRSELDLLGKDRDLTVVRNTMPKRADSGISEDDLRALLALTEDCEIRLRPAGNRTPCLRREAGRLCAADTHLLGDLEAGGVG